MSTRRFALLAVLAAVLAPFAASGIAVADDGPIHHGPPAKWGPPLEALCSDPALAAAAGYNVIVLDNMPNTFVGTAMADAIYALDGNDRIRGGPGDDVICLGRGDDKGRGDTGNDAVFGEDGKDLLWGNAGRDFLNGGPLYDKCDGGPALDAAVLCEVVVNVP
jgi:Ca2+-binding RTX toxin-like protein